MITTGLNRFIQAQELNYKTALYVIRSGQKRSHWIWYIFPQISGLAFSEVSKRFAIRFLDEAREYLNHPVLGDRLKEITEVLLRCNHNDSKLIFGRPDHLKLKSCMRLFDLVDVSEERVFSKVLEKFFNGTVDEKTVKITHSVQ